MFWEKFPWKYVRLPVGKPSKNLNSVYFSSSCSLKKIHFNTDLYSTIKKKFFIELENDRIRRLLLSISRINIALIQLKVTEKKKM